MKILNPKTIPEADIITQSVRTLRLGGLLIYPTETVYGLGADATNQKAVDKLLKFKGQRGLKPILIAVSDQKMAEKYVDLNHVARRLYRTFLPGPVAIISKVKTSFAPKRLSKLANLRVRLLPSEATRPGDSRGGFAPSPAQPDEWVTANEQISANEIAGAKPLVLGIASPQSTVGIRIPAYPLTLKIIKTFGKPITSTSANISAARHPWSLQNILDATPKPKLDLIDLIIDAGQLPRRPPSTVIDTSEEETEIIRQGEVGIEAILNTEYRMLNEKHISQSPEETQQIAKRIIWQLLSHSVFSIHNSVLVIALHGPLGAGKTVFTKGLAAALGISAPLRSPSYTLVKEYSIPSSFGLHPSSFLYHLDAWRLSSPQEFADLGLETMLRPDNIIVIEWIDRLAPILKHLQKQAKVILVEINVINKNQRHISVTM